MQPVALRALEFERIVEAVRRFALTPMGDARLADLAPALERDAVAHLLAGTTEARRYLATRAAFPLRAAPDLLDVLGLLTVEGRALEPQRLLALASFLDSLDETRAAIRRAPGAFPQLTAAAGGAASFTSEIADTRRAIDPSGEVLDDASPALRGLRDRLRRQRTRLRATLESYLRGKDTAKYLQELVVTERNGRSVLVIRAEHRSGIPGIVHGASTSGASLYMEPLATVEINNDIVAVEEQEAEEVLRILLALTDAFRARAADMEQTVAAATELDVLQARARYSSAIDGIEPALSRDGAFELQAARHPLLTSPVPVTIKIVPPATSLLITGPNTGGKTVALKTAGLLALMAQAGLHIPAEDGSRLPVFRSMFADIGDEQSIDASLSTFSAHITKIVSMDRGLQTPALVLLDEVGSGTDPLEGGALGVAIVDHLRRRGATIIATSHYDALKTYASTTAGVAGAAFGFNADTFAPTYQLVYGSPGRSLAIEIASRIGLNPSVIAAARANLSARESQLAEHLAKIDTDIRALDDDRRRAAHERDTLDAAGQQLRAREEALRQREDTYRRRLTDQLEEQVRRGRREIDDVIGELKAKTRALAQEAARLTAGARSSPEPIPRLVPAAGAAGRDARAAIDAVAKRLLDHSGESSGVPHQPIADAPPDRLPVVGDRVVVGGLGLEGVVTMIHDNAAEIDVRGKRMRSSVRDLRVVGGAEPPAAQRVRVNVELQPRETTSSELNLVGCKVDEALERAGRFLDESLLTDRQTIRLIHGYGTGQLKRALAGFLQGHPLVAHFETAQPSQGGGGVTVVELKD